MRLNDLTNQRFGLLTVLGRDPELPAHGRINWLCRCDCGNQTSVCGSNLTSGRTASCGCRKVRHGQSYTPEYRVWLSMKQRCLDPNSDAYANYGGRGIAIDPRWITAFENFAADMGSRPSDNHSIERRDVNGDYEPGNCYWGTWDEQANNRRNNRTVTHEGVTKTVAQWARDFGIGRTTLEDRLYNQNLSFDEAISRPLGPGRRG